MATVKSTKHTKQAKQLMRTVPIEVLKTAKFNPKTRGENVASLADSMDKVGQLYPILVTDKLDVIDGHRRLAAAKKLSWEQVSVLITEGQQPDLYAAVNSSVHPIRGAEQIQIYLLTPNAVTERVRKRIAELEAVVGRRIVERMGRERFSLGTWLVAKRIASVSDCDDVEFLKKAVLWLMKYRCADSVRRALAAGVAPSKIMSAINNDKPIRVSYQ